MKTLTPKQQQWLLDNNKTYPIKCKMCDNEVKWRASSAKGGLFNTYCSPQCSRLDTKLHTETRKCTNLEKYGHENAQQNHQVRQKTKQTNLEKYGHENAQQNHQVRRKFKQTMVERYGVEYSGQSDILLNKQNQTNLIRYDGHPTQTLEVQDKIRNTNLKKYKAVSFLSSVEGQLVSQQTNLKKYGVRYPIQNKQIQEKQKQTNLERYGVNYSIEHIDVKNRALLTNLKIYGVNCHNQQHMIDIIHLIEDYDWLYEQYITQHKTATQIALELGINVNTSLKYLRLAEIEIRQSYKTSFKANQWLDQIEKEQGLQLIREYPIEETRYKSDGYCEKTKTIYEFYGDYWHGNPEVFGVDVLNESTHCTMGELYQRTTERENQLISLGYKLVIMWENEYNKLTKIS